MPEKKSTEKVDGRKKNGGWRAGAGRKPLPKNKRRVRMVFYVPASIAKKAQAIVNEQIKKLQDA